MTAPRVPITREEYDELVAMGVSREEINAKAVLAPTGGGKPPAPKVPLDPVGVAMQGLPVVGPWTDEAIGGASGATQYLLDKVRGKPATLKGSVQQGMRDADARVRATRAAMNRVVPGSDLTLETATGLATGGAAAKAAPKAVQALLGNVRSAGRSNKVVDFLEKAAKRVGAGAGAGAIMGAGAAREGERGEGAAMGGMAGAALGAVPSVVEGGAIAKDRLGSWWRGRAPENVAAKALEKTVRVDQLDDVLAGRTPTRAETVADVAATSPSNYTDALGREAISQPTEAGGAIKRQMAERAAGRGQRVMQTLETQSGLMAEQPEVTKRMIDEVTKPNVKSAYRAVMNPKKALDSDELRDILLADDPAVKKAMAGAVAKMKERRIPKARSPWLTDGGDVAMWQTADFNAPFIDYTKRGLDAQITSAIKQDRLDDAAAIAITRSRLVKEADRLIPGYAEARSVDEGRRALINAMELGRKLGKGTADVRDAQALLARLTPDSPEYASPEMVQEMFRRGVADGLRRRMGRAADGVQSIKALIGNPNAEDVARLAFPDDASFQAFQQQLMDEISQLPGEAMTRGAKVDASMFSDNALGAATPWSLAQALKGNPSLLTAQMAGDITRQSGHQMNEKAAGVIANVMRSRPGDKNVQDILRRIAQQRAEPARRAVVTAAAGKRGTTTNIALQRLLQAYLGQGGRE